MAKTSKKVKSNITASNVISSTDITEYLEKIALTSNNTASGLTYYFSALTSNPNSNVSVTKIMSSEYTYYHKHDFYEINFVAEGTLYEHVGGTSFCLEKGDFIIMPPSVFHTCFPDSQCVAFNILLRRNWVTELSQKFALYDSDNYLTRIIRKGVYSVFYPSIHDISFTDDVMKIYNFSQIINRHLDLYENLKLENMITDFLLSAVRCSPQEYASESGKRLGRPNYSPDDIIRYITDNFSTVTLDEAASRFGYSRSQLHRIIKKNTDNDFSGLILETRMQRARHLLLNTLLPIKEIARILGIDSPEHFARMFKKNRHMSPLDYRKSFSRLYYESKMK